MQKYWQTETGKLHMYQKIELLIHLKKKRKKKKKKCFKRERNQNKNKESSWEKNVPTITDPITVLQTLSIVALKGDDEKNAQLWVCQNVSPVAGYRRRKANEMKLCTCKTQTSWEEIMEPEIAS